jgi:hypothetical protein
MRMQVHLNKSTNGNWERSFMDEYMFGKTECPE